MVETAGTYNFIGIAEEFIALKPFSGPHADHLRDLIRTRAREVLAHPDIRYMPAFKILDLLAEMINAASAIAGETQLRKTEATALLHSEISDNAPLIRHFLLEAALERARYEPMMLDASGTDAASYRNLALRKRWEAMRAAHQSLHQLNDDWLRVVDHAVKNAITATSFSEYRTGPLLQFFAEMLQIARQYAEIDKSLAELVSALGSNGALWKRYALKSARFRDDGDHISPLAGIQHNTNHLLH